MACRREEGEQNTQGHQRSAFTASWPDLKSLAFCFMSLADVIFLPAGLEECPLNDIASPPSRLPCRLACFSLTTRRRSLRVSLCSAESAPFAFYRWDLLRQMHIIEGIRRMPSLFQLLWYSICNRSLSGLNYCCPGVLRSQFPLLGPCRDGCLFVHLV